MILTCPSCATRYQINPTALGGMGRRVRCVRCHHNWYQEVEVVVTPLVSDASAPLAQTPPAEEDVAQSVAPVVTPPPELPVAAPLPEEDDLYFADETADSDDPDVAVTFEDEEDVAESPLLNVDPAAVGNRLPAVRRTRSGIGQAVGWLLLLLTVGAIVAGLWYGRDPLVAYWPPADRLYQILDGITVPEKQIAEEQSAPQNKVGLAIQDVTHKYLNTNGANLLQVSGRVVNITDETRPVPRLRVSLQDKNTRELVNWVVVPTAPRLAPGAALAFETEIDNAPKATRNLGVTFVGADLDQDKQN